MKTVGQALVDEVHIPIPYGFVENACIKRDLDIESEFTGDVARSDAYKGTLADCLLSLIQAVSFSEADKSNRFPLGRPAKGYISSSQSFI